MVVAIETLRISMRKRPLANLNNTLLDRLVKTGLLNICFTERQKLSLLNVAGAPCPPPTPFHDLNLHAIAPTTPLTPVTPCPLSLVPRPPSPLSCGVFVGYADCRQALIPIVSELLVCGDGVGVQTMTMRDFARTELAVITRAWATLRSQGGEVGMRVVGVAGRSGVEGVGGGRG